MFKRPYRKIVYRKKVNILLVQIVNRNLGDAVIADNAEYLASQALPRLARRHYTLQRYDIQSGDYGRVKEADLLVFCGGGLIKYKQEEFYKHVPALLECARENNIPVYFNSVGVEGYDGQDPRCQSLAQALNCGCVKGMTVRDDLATLCTEYLQEKSKGHMMVAQAVDTAVFTPEVYGIQKESGHGVIGLGIVRSRIFEDYGLAQVTRQFQLDMWKGIVQELEKRGYGWKFFVNGLRSDYDFAQEVLEYMGRASQEEGLLVPRPVASSELVGTVASFAGVIACRMHANIIAYALGVPSVGLVWNDKMVFWGERIGYPERFLSSGQFEPAHIVQCLMDSMEQGVRPCPASLKNSVKKPFQKFIRKYGALAWKEKRGVYVSKPLNWAGRLVASALGGIDMRYTNMNAPKGLERAIQNGFSIFEADIRLTKDKRLVCVNGWSNGSYEKLGMQPGQPGEGMDYGTFMQCLMYGSFQTMDAFQLFRRMRQEEGGWKLILDIGKPNKETLADMIGALQELFAQEACEDGQVLIRLQGKYDVEAVQEAGMPVQVMYYVPPKQKREEKGLSLDSIGKYCKKRGIQWVSMPKEAMDEEVMSYLKKAKLKSCIFSFNQYTEVLHALELGADWIGTSYLSPRGLGDWYEDKMTVVIR